MEKKPRIFIASSKDNVEYAHAVHRYLNNNYAYTKLWETAVEPGEYTLPALLKTFDDYDFGIFVFSEDDIVHIRNKEYTTVRDNVLFEFGLFIGKHGINSAFILTPSNCLGEVRIASDLFGITVSTFDSNRKNDEILDAISSSCLNILAKIKRILSEEGADSKKSISDNPYFGICRHEANMFTEVADMLTNAREKVILFITNNERLVIFDLFISFIYTRFNKVIIDVHYFPQIQKDTNSYSIEIFKQIGCNVKEYPIGEAPNTIAFIADPKDPDYARMIVKTERFTRKNVFAYIYKGAIHHQAIKSVANDFESLEKPKNEYIPKIVKISEKEMQDAFSHVPMYKLNNCKFSIVEVDALSTLPQSDNLVREYKIKQISLLDRMYETLNIDLYEPTAVILKNKKKHLIVPPVLEEKEGKLYVAEGHTRLYIHKDKKKIKCVKVVGIKDPLPCEPATWDKIEIAPDSVFKLQSGDEASLQRTRKIEKYLHKADWFEDKKRL